MAGMFLIGPTRIAATSTNESASVRVAISRRRLCIFRALARFQARRESSLWSAAVQLGNLRSTIVTHRRFQPFCDKRD
jgi:hypothetical protein